MNFLIDTHQKINQIIIQILTQFPFVDYVILRSACDMVCCIYSHISELCIKDSRSCYRNCYQKIQTYKSSNISPISLSFKILDDHISHSKDSGRYNATSSFTSIRRITLSISGPNAAPSAITRILSF